MKMMEELFARLAESDFRSRFRLKETDFEYIQKKGMERIENHARDFVRKRLAPAVIPNDGKQTPMRGHPVFPAQHATACCCRGCLYKWHRFEPGKELTEDQQDYIVAVIMEWIRRQMVMNNVVIDDKAPVKAEEMQEYEQLSFDDIFSFHL